MQSIVLQRQFRNKLNVQQQIQSLVRVLVNVPKAVVNRI